MARIGIYGGSFNPPHLGHVLAAREFQRTLNLDKMLFIPAAIPPHKILSPGSPDGRDRMELLRLAVRELPFAEVDDLELQRDGVSYTVDTLRSLRAKYPDDALFLCVGTDMFLTFDTWYHPQEICSLATIAMAHRADCDEDELKAMAQSFCRRYGTVPALIENEFVEMSSTEARRLLILGGAEDLLDPAVLDAIHAKGLYGTGENRKNLPFDALCRQSLALHKASRVAHVKGCSDTAAELAVLFGADPEDARRAGILHDVTKALDGRDQLRLCDKYGIILDDFDRNHTKLLHSVTGAAVAKYVFGENDAVVNAIRWHTSGRANMTTLEKILYVADYMEPNRDFPGVEQMRKLAHEDLDAAMLLGLQMTKEHLQRQGAEMGRHSVEAIAYFTKQKGTIR